MNISDKAMGFINYFRQTGSTIANVAALTETGGIYVMEIIRFIWVKPFQICYLINMSQN